MHLPTVCLIGFRFPVLMLASLHCLGQSNEIPGNREPLDKTDSVLVSVSGVVVDENERPLGNVDVYLREWAVVRDSEFGPSHGVIFHPQRKYTFANSKTDDMGKFQFESVEVPTVDPAQQTGPSRWTVVAVVPDRAIAWFKLVGAQTTEPIRLIVRRGTTVEGVVLDSQGRPVANAEVYVDEVSEPKTRRYQVLDSPQQFVFRNSDLSPRATTNDEGRFAISNLPLDQRIGIAVIHDEFVPEIVYAATTKELQPIIEEQKILRGKYVTTTYPVQSGTMQVELVRGHRIEGQIVYDDNKPASNQDFIISLDPSNESWTIRTDSEGRFATRRFHDSTARLFVAKPNDEKYAQADELVRFEPADVEKKIVVTLPLAGIIRGTLNSADAQPIVGANVAFVPDQSINTEFDIPATIVKTTEAGEFEMQVSDEAGTLFAVGPVFGYELASRWQILEFQRGTLTDPPEPSIRIEAASFADGPSEDGARTADVTLIADRALQLTGKVIDDQGNAVSNATIGLIDGLFEWNGPFVGMDEDEIKRLFLTHSDEHGQFTVSGIPRNNGVVFRALDPGNRIVALIYFDKLPKTDNVEVQLTEGLTLRGMVTVDGTAKPDVRVSMNVIGEYEIDKQGKSVAEQFLWDVVRTDGDGKYQFTAVPEKPQYFVSAMIDSEMSKSRNPKREENKMTIDVPVFDFVSLDAEISGVVLDPSGNPVAGVKLTAEGTKNNENYTTSDESGRPLISETDGSFTLSRLPVNTPITIRAFFERRFQDGSILGMPAEVDVMSGDRDVRIVFDPRLNQGPRKR